MTTEVEINYPAATLTDDTIVSPRSNENNGGFRVQGYVVRGGRKMHLGQSSQYKVGGMDSGDRCGLWQLLMVVQASVIGLPMLMCQTAMLYSQTSKIASMAV